MTFHFLSSPLAKLAHGSLVCHDHFGLGYTLSRVQKTSACALGKVRVAFDDDAFDPSKPDASFNGRSSVATDTAGERVTTRYRFVLCSFLDWDGEDETSVSDEVEVTPDEEPVEVVPVDENGFDTMEGIEAEVVAEEQVIEDFSSVTRLKRGAVSSYRPGSSPPPIVRKTAEEACAHLPEDDADFAERMGQEPTVAIEEAALLADFAAEFDAE